MGTSSDHAGLHLQFTRLEKTSTSFKFFNSWLRDDDFNCRFREAWKATVSGSPLFQLQIKINAVRAVGKDWARAKRSSAVNSRKVVADLQAIAVHLQLDPLNLAIHTDFKEAKGKLIVRQHRKRMDLQQRAHANWIKEGDQGTRFFAQAIKSRQTRNSIMGTLDNSGIQTNSLEEMKERATNYFSGLFSVSDRPRPIPNLNLNINIEGPMLSKMQSSERTLPLMKYGTW